jgi:predicted Zn-dependent peptidase
MASESESARRDGLAVDAAAGGDGAEAVARGTFAGLRVVHQFHPGKLCAIALAIRAGSRWDAEVPGLAHVSEHMLFQGTSALGQVELNRRAAELGGEHNADTGYEDISLTFEVFNEDLEAALSLMADQYYDTVVDERTLRKELRVVMEEIRGRMDDPAERLFRRAWSRLFGGALAHPVAGVLSSVRDIGVADVEGFLRQRLNHASTVLSIVGGVEFAAVRELVPRIFNRAGAGCAQEPPPIAILPGGPCSVRSRDRGQAYLAVLMAIPPDHRQILATGVALDILGTDPDSRLFQELRERLGLSYDVAAQVEWGPDWALASVSSSCSRSRIDRLVRAVEEIFTRAGTDGFDADEVLRARKKLRYRNATMAESRFDQALALAENALWGAPTPGEAEAIVASLSHAEIETAWRRALGSPRVTAVLR